MNTTVVEPKKEKKLDRNHWMCRLQKYVFNIDAEKTYFGFCPLFWMSWLALICLPSVFVAQKLLLPIFKVIAISSQLLFTSLLIRL